jgi:hypothetical protein
MGFIHDAGVALDAADFWTIIEASLAGAGWILVSGHGTTDIVYRSTGELGTRTKLFVRIWRPGGNPDRVYFRVQDDAAGTHATSDPTSYPTMPGLGAIPFAYWLTCDKDAITLSVKNGASYGGLYAGLVEPFAVGSAGEEQEMVVWAPHSTWARVLRTMAGAWNQTCTIDQLSTGMNIMTLDNAYTIFGCFAYRTTNDETYGQLKYISGRISTGAGVNPEDTVDSGFPGATSSWIIMGTAALRWAMATSAPLPLGLPDGTFAFASGTAADYTALFTAYETLLTGLGWICANWTGVPGGPIDRTWHSLGESGVDDLWIRAYWDAGNERVTIQLMDDATGTHASASQAQTVLAKDWPVYYYMAADKDLVLGVVEIEGNLIDQAFWVGIMRSAYIDPDSLDTVYKAARGSYNNLWMIRNPLTGAWAASFTLTRLDDNYTNSSPNLADGVSFVLWPSLFYLTSTPVGARKYLYRCSSTHLSVRDTVRVGAQQFMYIGDDWAMRIA